MDRRFDKKVYRRAQDSGGMFDDELYVTHNPDEEKPYFAMAANGWAGGYGKAHYTLEEAIADIPRLYEKLMDN